MLAAASIPDILSGKLDNVAAVAERRTGRRPSPPTVWRWCRQGLRGGTIKLQALYHGGSWRTTEAAFDEFIADQTAAAMADPVSDRTVDDDALQAAGLL